MPGTSRYVCSGIGYEANEAVGDGRKAAQSRGLKAIAYMHLPVPQKKANTTREL